MKILQVFSFLSLPRGGGIVYVISAISRALQQRGHDVTIYTSDFELDQPYIDSLKGITVYPFHSYINTPGMYVTPDMIQVAGKQLHTFDIIHLHSHRSFQNIVIHRYARKYRIPYVVEGHGSTTVKQKKTLLKKLYDLTFGESIYRDCNKFIVHNDFDIAEHRELGIDAGRIALIEPPFPVEDYDKLPPTGQFRKDQLITQKHILLFLGRINWIKGIDFLIESFYELTGQRNDVMLVIAGADDGYKPALEKLIERLNIQDRVLFTGFLDGTNKLSAIVDASVVVLTSRYEQRAGAPFEAVLCGTPIIVSKHTGAAEDVQKIDAGYLVEFGDKRELVTTINNILNDPSEAKSKAGKAAVYIRQNLSTAKKVLDYEKLYETCIKANKTHR